MNFNRLQCDGNYLNQPFETKRPMWKAIHLNHNLRLKIQSQSPNSISKFNLDLKSILILSIAACISYSISNWNSITADITIFISIPIYVSQLGQCNAFGNVDTQCLNVFLSKHHAWHLMASLHMIWRKLPIITWLVPHIGMFWEDMEGMHWKPTWAYMCPPCNIIMFELSKVQRISVLLIGPGRRCCCRLSGFFWRVLPGCCRVFSDVYSHLPCTVPRLYSHLPCTLISRLNAACSRSDAPLK